MELTRLFDLIPYQIEKYNKDIAFSRKEDGVWKTYSSKEAQSIIDELSLGFLAKGNSSWRKSSHHLRKSSRVELH
jgi:long-chain acyl-CoA synthetase